MKIRSSFPFFSEESVRSILADIRAALREGNLANGPRVQEFERKFCEYTKQKHAVAVSSGGASLEISLRYFGVKEREVIVPTNTFVATPNTVLFAGGRPVFADIREDTLCIDPDDVKKRISSKTAGVIVVHIAGLVCPQIDELREICNDHDLFLLEDCAHAHGALIDNRAVGTIGDAGCYSFAPTKVMTTGEGGMLLTDNPELAEKARVMRNRGLNSDNLMIMLGHSWTMSEVNAILGLDQLKNLDYFLERRNNLARQYESLLGNADNLSLFKTPPNIRHSYHKFPVAVKEDLSIREIASVLREKYEIETSYCYYPPCHLHPFYRANLATREGDLPVAERVMKQVLSLPIDLALTNEEIRYICKSLTLSIDTLSKG